MYALLCAENSDEFALLSVVLQRAGLVINVAKDLLAISQKNWLENPVDLILIALSNPSLLEQVHYVRTEVKVPLILITDAINEQLHCNLLEAGADLIINRPFSSRLLIFQVRTLLRRSNGSSVLSLPTFSLAGLTLDPATRTVTLLDQPSKRLTHLEFRLLYTLIINRGQILPTETIVDWVWGHSGRGDKELVRGLISRLRSKVEIDPQKPTYIVTVPRVGYLFRNDDDIEDG